MKKKLLTKVLKNRVKDYSLATDGGSTTTTIMMHDAAANSLLQYNSQCGFIIVVAGPAKTARAPIACTAGRRAATAWS